MSTEEFWDVKALLLRMLQTERADVRDLVKWMCFLRRFYRENSPGNPSYDACLLVGVEPTSDNKLCLALACERLTGDSLP